MPVTPPVDHMPNLLPTKSVPLHLSLHTEASASDIPALPAAKGDTISATAVVETKRLSRRQRRKAKQNVSDTTVAEQSSAVQTTDEGHRQLIQSIKASPHAQTLDPEFADSSLEKLPSMMSTALSRLIDTDDRYEAAGGDKTFEETLLLSKLVHNPKMIANSSKSTSQAMKPIRNATASFLELAAQKRQQELLMQNASAQMEDMMSFFGKLSARQLEAWRKLDEPEKAFGINALAEVALKAVKTSLNEIPLSEVRDLVDSMYVLNWKYGAAFHEYGSIDGSDLLKNAFYKRQSDAYRKLLEPRLDQLKTQGIERVGSLDMAEYMKANKRYFKAFEAFIDSPSIAKFKKLKNITREREPYLFQNGELDEMARGYFFMLPETEAHQMHLEEIQNLHQTAEDNAKILEQEIEQETANLRINTLQIEPLPKSTVPSESKAQNESLDQEDAAKAELQAKLKESAGALKREPEQFEAKTGKEVFDLIETCFTKMIFRDIKKKVDPKNPTWRPRVVAERDAVIEDGLGEGELFEFTLSDFGKTVQMVQHATGGDSNPEHYPCTLVAPNLNPYEISIHPKYVPQFAIHIPENVLTSDDHPFDAKQRFVLSKNGEAYVLTQADRDFVVDANTQNTFHWVCEQFFRTVSANRLKEIQSILRINKLPNASRVQVIWKTEDLKDIVRAVENRGLLKWAQKSGFAKDQA